MVYFLSKLLPYDIIYYISTLCENTHLTCKDCKDTVLSLRLICLFPIHKSTNWWITKDGSLHTKYGSRYPYYTHANCMSSFDIHGTSGKIVMSNSCTHIRHIEYGYTYDYTFENFHMNKKYYMIDGKPKCETCQSIFTRKKYAFAKLKKNIITN